MVVMGYGYMVMICGSGDDLDHPCPQFQAILPGVQGYLTCWLEVKP